MLLLMVIGAVDKLFASRMLAHFEVKWFKRQLACNFRVITVKSKWARLRLKPASRLFTQPFVEAQIKENVKAPRHSPLCAGNTPVTGEFPAQMASNAENVSIWWPHHEEKNHFILQFLTFIYVFIYIKRVFNYFPLRCLFLCWIPCTMLYSNDVFLAFF